MQLEVDPEVDSAFGRVSGMETPRNVVVEVALLNPFSSQDAADDKLSILDIKARDQIGRWLPVAETRDARKYRASRKAVLFEMFPIDPSSPGADEGLVNGTVPPDGKKMVEIGRIASCMKCHPKAPHGRLLGLPRD